METALPSLVVPEVMSPWRPAYCLNAYTTSGRRRRLGGGMRCCRQVFSTLDGEVLVAQEEARKCTLWWRRRGIEPLVQTKASPNLLQA